MEGVGVSLFSVVSSVTASSVVAGVSVVTSTFSTGAGASGVVVVAAENAAAAAGAAKFPSPTSPANPLFCIGLLASTACALSVCSAVAVSVFVVEAEVVPRVEA